MLKRSSDNRLNGAQVIVDYLIREKVPYAFGLCGHGNIQFIDALHERQSDIKTISVHHESVCGFMADAYYRVKGQPVATFTSCGPGSVNLPIALATAYLDSVPFLAVTGNVPTTPVQPRRVPGAVPAAPGGLPLHRPLRSASGCTSRPAASRCRMAVRQAWKTMVTGRPGPVVLDVPFDVFMEAAAEETPKPEEWSANISSRCGADPDGVEKAVDMLLAAERPVILVGQGVKYGGATADLLALAEKLQIPVGAFDERHRRDRHAPSAVARPACRAAAPIRRTARRGRPTCCWRSACASTTAPRARGFPATRSPSRRPSSFTSTSIRKRSAATIRSRSA